MPLSHAGPPADPHPPGLSCTCHRPSAPAARSAWAAPLLTPCIRGLAWGLPLAATQAERSVWLVLCRVQATSFIFHPQGHLAPASTHSCLFKHSVPSFSTVPHRPACSSPSHSPQSRPSPPRPPPSDRHTGRPPRVLLPPCRGVRGWPWAGPLQGGGGGVSCLGRGSDLERGGPASEKWAAPLSSGLWGPGVGMRGTRRLKERRFPLCP